MATTAQQLITEALRLIGAIEARETPSAEDAASGLSALNQMLDSWEKERVPGFSHTTLALGDNIALGDAWLEGIRFNLAVRLAPEYGAEVAEWIAQRAIATFNAFTLRRADQVDAADPTAGTAKNLIARAFRMIGLLRPGELPSTYDEASALTALNEMLHGWAKRGVDIQHVDLTLTDALLVHASWLEGIAYNLAVRLADDYPDAVLKPHTMERAREAFQEFQAHSLEFDDDLKVDSALQPQYFNRRYGSYNIDEG